jgi:hypothetical protein
MGISALNIWKVGSGQPARESSICLKNSARQALDAYQA